MPILILSLLGYISCQIKQPERDSVLDSTPHLEDSIYYHIDSLPMLCEDLKMQGQMIDIGDCKLYCETKGEGTPIVLINGGPGGTHHCFHPWFKEAEKFSKIIYYDQRGCGLSDYIEGNGYNFRQAIDDLEKLRIKLNIDKWVLCGYSYGGALAQYYTATYPERVKAMVLIGSSPLIDVPNGTRQYDYISKEESERIKEIYALYREKKLNLFQLLYNKDLNGDWKRQNFYKPTKDDFIRKALYEWKHDKNFNSKMGSSYSRYNMKNVFNNNPIPTLICEGKWDLTWVAEKADIFRKNHPNAQFMMFEKSGHTIFSEEPELFFSTLQDFTEALKPIPESEIANWKEHAKNIIKPQEDFFRREDDYFKYIEKEGIDKAYILYTNYIKNNTDPLFSEKTMNNLGYSYLYAEEFEEAIKAFELNIKAYPDSYNVYDSLGEAYLKMGDKKNAKKYYKKSVELNPDNKDGIKALENL